MKYIQSYTLNYTQVLRKSNDLNIPLSLIIAFLKFLHDDLGNTLVIKPLIPTFILPVTFFDLIKNSLIVRSHLFASIFKVG